MTITKYETRTGVELVAEGTLNAIYFNELKEKKNYGRDGKDWIPTHSVNIVINDLRVSLGLTDKETIRCKDKSDNYQDLVKGQKVSVIVEENGEYKGVTQYQGRSSNLIILEMAAEQSGSQSGGNFKPRDTTGMEVGHCINGALYILRNGEGAYNDADVVTAAKEIHQITVALKGVYIEKNPDMSEFDIGSMVGHAVLNACRDTDTTSNVREFAQDTLENIVPEVQEFVKGSKAETAPAAVKKTVAKKTTAKKAAKVASVDEDLADHDEDLPF